MISRDAVGLPKNGIVLIEEETKKRILPFWPDAIISVRNQMDLKKVTSKLR